MISELEKRGSLTLNLLAAIVAFAAGAAAMIGVATDAALRLAFTAGRWAWLVLSVLGD